MANALGVYQTTYDYDENRRKTREVYFGADGASMVSTEGFVAKEFVYGEDGAVIETRGIEP